MNLLSFKAGLFGALSFFFFACGNQAVSENQKAPEDAQGVSAREKSAFFYKRLEGTIAGQPVVMQLVRNNEELNGLYYYRKTGGLIDLYGTISENGSFQLSEMPVSERYTSETDTEAKITGMLKHSELNGTWKSADGNKTFEVRLKETYPQGSYRLIAGYIADSTSPHPELENGPHAAIAISFLKPEDETPGQEFLNREINKIIASDSLAESRDAEETVRKVISQYLKDYKEHLPSPEDTGLNLSSPTFQYEFMRKMNVVYNENGILVLSSFYFDYSGGAHPNHGTSFVCLDVYEKKRLKLSDILKADSAIIVPIMEKYFRKARGLKPSEKLNTVLFESYLLPNENFFFNEKGLGFWYDPYEIAAYAYGDTEIFIPFSELKPYLNPDFLKRLKID